MDSSVNLDDNSSSLVKFALSGSETGLRTFFFSGGLICVAADQRVCSDSYLSALLSYRTLVTSIFFYCDIFPFSYLEFLTIHAL